MTLLDSFKIKDIKFQMKYKNIAVSGPIGSGKSTLARNLAESLGFQYVSAGEIMRAWHKKHQIPLEQSDKVPEIVDRDLENEFERMLKEKSRVVVEAHLAGYHARQKKDVFKILVTADFKVRMERTAAREGVTIEEAVKLSDKRAEAHRRKFKRLYGIEDRFDPKYFDLVVDTTKKSPQEVLEDVMDHLQQNS